MNSNIKKRKIRFWAFLMALVLMLPCTPITVEARVLTDNETKALASGNELYADDQFKQSGDGQYLPEPCPYVIYYQSDGSTEMRKDTLTYSSERYTVLDYSDMPSDKQEVGMADNFKCWEVKAISKTGSAVARLILTPVPWVTKNITYYVDGTKNNDTGNPATYREGEGLSSFSEPTRTGYSFDGWYKNADCTGTKEDSDSSKSWTGDINLYGKFTPKSYDIHYSLGGGTNGTGNPTSYTYGESVAATSLADPSKTGHRFDGWYTNAGCTDEFTGITATQTGDVTLYAKFTPESYNIYYSLDGGTNGAGNPTSYTYGEVVAVTSLADPSKTGHRFDGWYTNAGFTDEFTGITATQTGPVTLYAKFTPRSYNIAYELYEGTNGAGNPTSYTYGDTIAAASLSDPNKVGYTFHGWFTEGTFNTPFSEISATQTGDVTLYAKFEAAKYDIHYVLGEGATNASTNPAKYTYGEGVASFANAEKEGHTFKGWYKEATFATEVTSISATQTGDVTLYAKFEVAKYDINYVLGEGGTNAAANPTQYTYGEGVSSFANAEKEGHTFKGWYKESTFVTKVTSISATQTGDVTLYAKFEAAKYDIHYVLGEGATNASTNPAKYTYGEGVASFANAEKEGHTFKGWYKESTFATKVTSISATQTGDVTLYAKFEVEKYDINYVLGEGATNASTNPTQYTYGEGVSSFANAEKEGHTFKGWYKESTFATKVTSISATQTGDVTLYAKFEAKKYDIHYVLGEGATNASTNPAQYTYGEGVTSFDKASKTGHTFKGWYKESTFATEVTSISASQTGDVTLYAKFEVAKYDIHYVLGEGGTNASANPTQYTYGEGVSSFANAEKEGHAFKGWYKDASFVTKVTSISSTQTGDVTLYAKFEAAKYDIHYVLGEGVTNASTNPTQYTYGEGVSSFANAEKEGYTFKGWYKESTFATEVTSISASQTGDVTLYAKFEVAKYDINYVLGEGGTNASTNPTQYTYGEGVSSFANAEKEGHAFKGWYKDASFATKVTSISATQTGAITLYAKFEANKHNITYELDGGTNGAGNPDTYTYGIGVPNLADASKTGYTFEGWYEDEHFTGSAVTSISTTRDENVTLYAKFSVASYDITYELNGGTNGEGNPTKYTYGVGVSSFADAGKEGYSFEGWYSDSNFATKVTGISATQTGNVTLYAKFEANSYGITYELDGGINAKENPESYTYGIGVTRFADASKEGYAFLGWYSDADFTTPITSISERQIGRVTLYAKYAKKYAITYELDGGTNAKENPESYVMGTGVSSFADASKEGYTFDGWYSDSTFITKVTGISATQTGDITLYAKFTVKEEVEEVEEEEDEQETDDLTSDEPKVNKTKRDTKGDEPETGDNSPIALCLWIFAISGLAILFLRRYIVRLKKKN